MKKCEYCTFDENGRGKKWTDALGDTSQLVREFAEPRRVCIATGSVGDSNYGESAYIDYCPKCGRKLKDLSATAPNNRFKKYTDDLAETLLAKNKDYGNSFDKTLEKYGLIALAIRLDDKLSRLASLIKSGTQEVKDESLKDTLQDIAGYAILGMRYLDAHEKP